MPIGMLIFFSVVLAIHTWSGIKRHKFEQRYERGENVEACTKLSFSYLHDYDCKLWDFGNQKPRYYNWNGSWWYEIKGE